MTIDRITESSSSGYSSFDDNENKNVDHLDGKVRLSSKDEATFGNSWSGYPLQHKTPGKGIDKYSVSLLGSDDSGQRSKPESLKFTRMLGRGGFGAVWLVEVGDTADKYALKLLFDDKYVKKELENMQKVGNHPNIVSTAGIVNVEGRQGILMEYIPGMDLSELLSKMTGHYLHGTLSHSDFWGAVQYILRETLSGISYLQEKGYAHHDIKPQNILVHEELLIPKIIDLGNARCFGEKGGNGTELYLTPELISSSFKAPVSDKFDTYSVGQIIYTLFSKILDPGVETFFTAGAKYSELLVSERSILLYRLHYAMKKYQAVDASGEYNRALTPITQEALESNVQAVIQDSDVLKSAVERFYEKAGNENIPFDVMLEKELPKMLARENMVGRYRAGYESNLVKFINLVLHPDPALRPNAAEALKQPFLFDPLYKDEESAKAVIKRVFEMHSRSLPGTVSTTVSTAVNPKIKHYTDSSGAGLSSRKVIKK